MKKRRSVFHQLSCILHGSKYTRWAFEIVVKCGLGDFIYRIFSKTYLEDRKKFYNDEKVNQILNLLEDDESKEVYKSVISYRCTRKRKNFPKFNEDNQYFVKDIVNTSENEVFIDCGAYIGDTAEKFIKEVNGKYKKIICFEPDKDNFKHISENMSIFQNVIVLNKGTYSRNGKLCFSGSKGMDSSICENGENSIDIIDLDSVEECKEATFIKMDIEGAELESIKGAKNLILNNKPKLAICIYHSDEDMVEIIKYIHELVPEYRLYVRHHSMYEVETVLYCII